MEKLDLKQVKVQVHNKVYKDVFNQLSTKAELDVVDKVVSQVTNKISNRQIRLVGNVIYHHSKFLVWSAAVYFRFKASEINDIWNKK